MERGPDLLFAVIALELSFVRRPQLAAVMALLPARPGRSAADLFVERGDLSPQRAALVENVVAASIEDHGGDVLKAIASFGGNPFVEQTVVGTAGEVAPRGRSALEGVQAALGRPDRYDLVRELGRGGLGRVMLALDRDLMGREVAMKLLQDPAQAGSVPDWAPSPGVLPLRERFLGEAQITAQLTHPNIVAVFELGARPEGGLYYTMPVVSGRSLKEEIQQAHHRLELGETTKEGWGIERLRLLQAFQGVCHGLSYAHSRGVIHRDVKPANVMVGDHGETIVVDWGLARAQGKGGGHAAAEAGRSDRELERYIRTFRSQQGVETIDGTVTGTPAYMAPEQAEGRIHDVDARSDVYSLGAVLFEILTGRPPFEGASANEILAKVTRSDAPDPRAVATRVPVPDDLAAICQRAMRRAKGERYPNVRALLDDIVLAVEGGKERARRHTEAERLVDAGRSRAGAYGALREELRRLEQVAKETGAAFKGGEPVSQKAAWWRQQDDAKAAGRAILRTFAEAERLFHQALEQEHDHAGAREGLADLYYSQFRTAEGQDAADFQYYGELVRTYHDGKYARELDGAGTIAITSEPVGCEVHLYRYEERERRLIPIPWRAAAGWQPPLREGEVATSAGWYLSPSTSDPEAHCGQTPALGLAAPMGSYLAILRREGFRDLRLPLHVTRSADVRVHGRLYTEEEIGGPGFVCVPGGSFIAGGEPPDLTPWKRQSRSLDDFFIARFPVTCAEYLAFLNDVGRTDPAAARAHAPRWQERAGMHWTEEPEGVWRWPDGKDEHGIEWHADEPVVDVTCSDAEAYCAWRARVEGRPLRLAHEAEWEKAARGVDGRPYPWGHHLDPSWCNMASSRLDGALRRGPVGEFPVDESVYGVRDLAGNVCDWCTGLLLEDKPWRVARGGFYNGGHPYCSAASRYGVRPTDPFAFIGLRLAASPVR